MDEKESLGYNIGAIAIVTIIGEILWIQSGVMDGAGMAALIGNWLPLIVGIGTMLCHMITRLATKQYAWIVSLLGVLFILFLVVRAFVGE